MEPLHPLKALLQFQLGSDSSAVNHLPYVLDALTVDCFLPSPHLQKWTTRISSLLYSKDPGGRWAGLCIAHQTASLSKSTMIECAQGWLGVALPMLSKTEPLPTLKASLRLLKLIFTAATDIPEFQRQLATPNVPKFSQALIALAEKHDDLELKLLALTTVTRLIRSYPTLHRAVHAPLTALSLRLLSGTASRPTNASLLEAASRLYAALHFTGGKVGASNLWKKSVDDTLAFSWNALESLTSTILHEGRKHPTAEPMPSPDDPIIAIPLNLDRLHCGIVILCELLVSTISRPVQVPIRSIVDFIAALLTCTADDQVEGHVDPATRVMEISVIPQIWKLACDLISCLAKCTRHHLTPSAIRLVSYMTYHLEQKLTSTQRLPFLQAVSVLLSHTHPIHSALPPTRLARAILPSISIILAVQSKPQSGADISADGSKHKKGKKRARGYEGDEVFKTSRELVCLTAEDGNTVLAALDAIQIVLRNPHLSPHMHSLISRVLLSILLALPQMAPTSLSPDLILHRQLLNKVQQLCMELGAGTTSAMSRCLGLVVRAATTDGSEQTSSTIIQREVELLLHPRLPPLVRPLPHIQSLSLFRAEESQEEIGARESLGLVMANPPTKPVQPDATTSALRSNVNEMIPQYATEVQQSTLTPADPPMKPVEQQLSSPHPTIRPISPPIASSSTIPPLPDPLPSSTRALTPVKLQPVAVQSHDLVPADEDEQDEEMPNSAVATP